MDINSLIPKPRPIGRRLSPSVPCPARRVYRERVEGHGRWNHFPLRNVYPARPVGQNDRTGVEPFFCSTGAYNTKKQNRVIRVVRVSGPRVK